MSTFLTTVVRVCDGILKVVSLKFKKPKSALYKTFPIKRVLNVSTQ